MQQKSIYRDECRDCGKPIQLTFRGKRGDQDPPMIRLRCSACFTTNAVEKDTT